MGSFVQFWLHLFGFWCIYTKYDRLRGGVFWLVQ